MTKQIISLSDQAATRIKEIMSSASNDSIGVRVGVKSGGCAGMSYVMEYTNKINPNDEVIEDKGVKVFIDSAAVMYLLGTEMDYKQEEFSSQFVFNNPNETERCQVLKQRNIAQASRRRSSKYNDCCRAAASCALDAASCACTVQSAGRLAALAAQPRKLCR